MCCPKAWTWGMFWEGTLWKKWSPLPTQVLIHLEGPSAAKLSPNLTRFMQWCKQFVWPYSLIVGCIAASKASTASKPRAAAELTCSYPCKLQQVYNFMHMHHESSHLAGTSKYSRAMSALLFGIACMCYTYLWSITKQKMCSEFPQLHNHEALSQLEFWSMKSLNIHLDTQSKSAWKAKLPVIART